MEDNKEVLNENVIADIYAGYDQKADADYAQMIEILFAINNLLKQEANKIVTDNPNWDAQHDARVTVFWNATGVIDSAAIGMSFVKGTLREASFWQNKLTLHLSEGQTEIVAKQYLESGLEAFMKLGLIQLLFSVTESAFRAYLRALAPLACNRGTAEFKSIYTCLLRSHLSALPLDSLELLDLWREVRNVVHNNGVYFKQKDASDSVVVYKGETYNFRYGQKLDFVNWNLVLKLILDLRELLSQVVNDPNLRSFPNLIPDLSQ